MKLELAEWRPGGLEVLEARVLSPGSNCGMKRDKHGRHRERSEEVQNQFGCDSWRDKKESHITVWLDEELIVAKISKNSRGRLSASGRTMIGLSLVSLPLGF